MNHGYTVIEPSALVGLYGNPKYFELAVLYLYWLAERLERSSNEALAGISVDVIRVEYQGAYPALGVQGGKPDTSLSVAIEAEIETILYQSSALEVAQYAVVVGHDWKEVANRLFHRPGKNG
jgi:hypothetical protein